jgi:hypothetical protein
MCIGVLKSAGAIEYQRPPQMAPKQRAARMRFPAFVGNDFKAILNAGTVFFKKGEQSTANLPLKLLNTGSEVCLPASIAAR